MEPTQPLGTTLATLRREFDEAFARVPSARDGEARGLLAIRVNEAPFAVPLASIEGLFADRRIVALPSPLPELLGVTCFRGRVVPVYDLAALLFETASRSAPRWLVLVRGGAALGLAFDSFDGQVSLPSEAIRREPGGRECAWVAGAPRPVIDLADLAQQVRAKVDAIRRLNEINGPPGLGKPDPSPEGVKELGSGPLFPRGALT